MKEENIYEKKFKTRVADILEFWLMFTPFALIIGYLLYLIKP